ncbi:hypothetical protein AB0F72_08480 [Actinoplanes sp. NPDC023936]|uniref:hypothetical protein n=1 Tax=Actinoplanes sp. NPDC023936 TaxID=3154910 RepID=UPI0033F19BA2
MPQPTDERTEHFGHLTVTTWTDHDGISIQVFAGPHRQATLSATFVHELREQAITWYRHIRDAALAYKPIWLIEAEVSALIDAAQAVGADAELAASLAADHDTRQAEIRAHHRQEQAAAARIMAGPDDYRAARRAARNRIDPAVFQPTKSNVHCKPLTPAMRNLAARHRDGIVRLPAGVDWRLLRGIVRRGHGAVHEADRYRITAVRLNGRGLAVAEKQGQVAA